MNEFILFLNAPGVTLAKAGGKGAHLSEMVRAGFPVPSGYIITTAAYRGFINTNEITARILELHRDLHGENLSALQTTAQALRNVFHKAPVPAEIAEAILVAYQHLTEQTQGQTLAAQTHLAATSPNALPVAVRSSATAEDLPATSFAGQHETFLNIRGEEALLEAVKLCWSSLWTARAMAYRLHHRINPLAVNQAVVVQHMVRADAAGILFTAHPITGDCNEVVMNAAWGLGESVVSGCVTPDTIVVDKTTFEIKETHIAAKAVKTALIHNGTELVSVEQAKQQQAAITAEQALALARWGRALESHFGSPQDVEWAMAGEALYLLQSRPLTASHLSSAAASKTVPFVEVRGDDNWPTLDNRSPQHFDLWTRTNLGELWPDPVCPLLASASPSLVSKALGFSLRGVNPAFLNKIAWVKRFYGRFYFNEGALAYLFTHELGLPDSFIDRALGNRRRDVRPHASRFHLLKFLQRLPIVLKLAIRQQSAGKQLESLFPKITQRVAGLSERSYNDLTDRELWAEALVWLDYIQQVRNLQLEMTGLSMTAVSTLERLVLHWLKRQDLTRDLITNLAGIEAAEIGSTLGQMAQMIRELKLADLVVCNDAEIVLQQLRENAQAAPVLELLDNFLQRHGHRCANEEDWLYPRWAEAPAQIIEMLRVYLHPSSQRHPAQSELQQRRRREEALACVHAHLGWLRRAIFNVVLVRAQHAVRLRDNGKSYAMLASLPARRLAALFGKRWAQRGWLRQADDFFFLTVPDIQQIVAAGNPDAAQLDLLKIVAERHAAFEHWFKVEPPEVIGPDGNPLIWNTTKAPSENVLRGISISGGYVRGVARVIHDHKEMLQVHPGEILVTRAADAGWSAIFPILSGLVTEIGGQLSHAAILAREYGLPAVVDVHGATRIIRDGQLISLNGASGVICLEGATPT